MKYRNELVLALVLTLVSSSTPAHAAIDEAYFTLGSIEVVEVADETDPSLSLQLEPSRGTMKTPQERIAKSFDILEKLKNGEMMVDIILNAGKKIWEVIEANRPVATATNDVAHALPKGADHWNELEGWQTPVAKVFEVTYRNLYGAQVVRFKYRLMYTYGGSVEGIGQYLTQITIVPANLQVAWGYTFNAKGTVPSVLNAGTRKNPLAAAQVQLDWSVSTVLKHDQGSVLYYVKGDGSFDDLSEGR